MPPNKVICKECKDKGLKSRVYIGMSMTTAMYCPSYYDEDGKFHHHDENTTTTQFSCSNGHEWTEKSIGSCWCGWPNNEKDTAKELAKDKEDE